MRQYTVYAANFYGTYTAGTYAAASKEDACEQARQEYRRSTAGRTLKDSGAFRFWAVPTESTR